MDAPSVKQTSEPLPPLVAQLLKTETDNGSGHGKESVVPPGVAGWGWGPFFWNFIWAIPNNVPLGFLTLIPYVGFVMMFVLGKNGRVWAWQNRKWQSVEEFNKSQKMWSVTGIIYFVVTILISIWVFKTIASYYNNAFLGF